ncbi:MAG: hypothetical protein V2A62_05075 [Candidatus Woesearchaeota archaeon]
MNLKMRLATKEDYREDQGFPFLEEASIHMEEGPRMCGLAIVRTILDYQFGITLSEEDLIDRYCNLKRYKVTYTKDPDRIRKSKRFFCEYTPGYFPTELVGLIKPEVSQSIKAFTSRRGTINHLDHLLLKEGVLPITHQLVAYDEEGSRELNSHYMPYCGFNGREVRYHDPSQEEGFKVVPVEQFLEQWKNPEAGNERWYMAILPERVTLNREIFRGRYL